MIGWVFYICIGTVIVRVYIIVLYNTMRHGQRGKWRWRWRWRQRHQITPWSKHLPMLILDDVYLYRKLSNHVRHQAQTEQLLIR